MSREADMWGMNFGNPSSSYKIRLEVVESKHKLLSGEYPAHAINEALRNGLFDKILGGNGRLMSMSTEMRASSSFITSMDFITHDIVGFVNSIEDFGWKACEKEFDILMTEELSED